MRFGNCSAVPRRPSQHSAQIAAQLDELAAAVHSKAKQARARRGVSPSSRVADCCAQGPPEQVARAAPLRGLPAPSTSLPHCRQDDAAAPGRLALREAQRIQHSVRSTDLSWD